MNSDNEADVGGTGAVSVDGTAEGVAARGPRAAQPASSVTAIAAAVPLERLRTA